MVADLFLVIISFGHCEISKQQSSLFMCPGSNYRMHIVLSCLFVCLSVRLFTCLLLT